MRALEQKEKIFIAEKFVNIGLLWLSGRIFAGLTGRLRSGGPVTQGRRARSPSLRLRCAGRVLRTLRQTLVLAYAAIFRLRRAGFLEQQRSIVGFGFLSAKTDTASAPEGFS